MRTKLGNNPRIRNLFTTFALGIRTNGCFFNRTEEVMKTQEIRIEDYNYSLPDERIAKFPLPKRDESKLLLYRNGAVFKNKTWNAYRAYTLHDIEGRIFVAQP